MKRTLLRKMLLSSVMAIVCISLAGCSSCNTGVEGKYQDESHLITLELGPGGKGSIALGAMSSPATYTVSGNNITVVDEQGAKTVFTLNPDGSLNGPPNGMIGKMVKVK
jgi:hypothetical protein